MEQFEHMGLSDNAEVELLQMCEEQFSRLEKLQNDILLSDTDSCRTIQEQSVIRLLATETEGKQWQEEKPKLLATNSEILLAAGKDELIKLCSELELVLSCCEAKRDNLRETKELEQKWLDEKKQVLKAVSDHVEQLKREKETSSQHNVLLETKEKIQKIKNYTEKLMQTLADVLDTHLPYPQSDFSSSKKKKITAYETTTDLISLHDILEILMNKTLNTPHDPYILIDDTFWPPYVELLLRYGVAVRHQENNLKIRLETFF